MNKEEIQAILSRLRLECDAEPTLVYIFYENADGRVNNLTLSLQHCRTQGQGPLRPERMERLMQEYPDARDAKVLAVEHPRTDLSQWLDVPDVCRRLHTTYPTLHRWIGKGLLHPSRVGRRLYFDPTEVEALLRSNIIQPNGKADLTGA